MKKNPTTGRLTLICLQTGKEIETGVVYTQDDLERAKPAKVLERCRHCGKSHIFRLSDAYLKPTGIEGRSD